MSPARDPIALLRLALRDGDLELASALVKSFRTSAKLARRADAELRATPRLASAADRTYLAANPRPIQPR